MVDLIDWLFHKRTGNIQESTTKSGLHFTAGRPIHSDTEGWGRPYTEQWYSTNNAVRSGNTGNNETARNMTRGEQDEDVEVTT